jgi:precorrin-2/cobalt-factor-2 C20-methyltransferase
MLGRLYGIGVGPGDPELLTLKAVRVLKRVEYVFAAASTKNDYSLAHEIVRAHLPPSTPLDLLAFPMTFNPDHLEDAWVANCEKVVEILKQGKHVAFLTLGDPLTFSTFIYLMRKIRKRLPEVAITVIPGITSFQAAAACATLPLAEGEEVITVISGAKGAGRLKDVIQVSDSVVLMKTYKQFPEILGQIEDIGLKDHCCFISRCGLEGEVIERDFQKLSQLKQPHYLSLMIVKKRGLEAKEGEAEAEV